MAQLKVPCPTCGRVSAIDSAKVPDRPVSFACPGCKAKVVVDKSKLLAEMEPELPALRSARPADAPPQVPLPPGARIPAGAMLGDDPEVMERLAGLLEPTGSVLEETADGESLLDRAETEGLPPLLVFVSSEVGPVPHPILAPLGRLSPTQRRSTLVVLVAPEVRTLDGNRAFAQGVDLLVHRDHLSAAPGAIYSALWYRERLYRPYLEILGEV